MREFPEWFRIPLGSWVDSVADWLTTEGATVFQAISDVLFVLLLRIERALLWIPWPVLILAVAILAWRIVGARLAGGVVVGLLFIGALGLWPEAMATLALVVSATLLATVLGLPVGILMSGSDTARTLIRPLLDLMQTMPSFVYLIPALMLFGLGRVPALMATLVYAIPPVIRLTNLGIRQVSSSVVEAARSFGSTTMQILFWVQIPLAMPTIMAGINQTIMMALAMVVIASMIGAGGLGDEVLRAIGRLEVGRGFTGGISIVIMAIIIDRITAGLGERSQHDST